MARKEFPPKTTPKVDPSKRREGSTAVIKRNKKGDLEATLKPDFGGISQASLRESRLQKAGTGDGTFKGGPAPRVGGKQTLIGKSGPLKSASKKVVRQSRRKPTGSPQARASQKRNRI